jgi:hypothetical protein
MDSNHPRRLYESRVLPTELASLVLSLAGRAGFEPAHGVSNSHVPFQLGYRPRNIRKMQKAPTIVGAFVDLNLSLVRYGQTNPEGRARLTRRLTMDLVFIVIFKPSIARLLQLESIDHIFQSPAYCEGTHRPGAIPGL